MPVITIARLDAVSTYFVYCLTIFVDGGETTPLIAVLNSTGKYQLATSTACSKTMDVCLIMLSVLAEQPASRALKISAGSLP